MLDPALVVKTTTDWASRMDALTREVKVRKAKSAIDLAANSALEDAAASELLEDIGRVVEDGPPDDRHHLTIEEYLERVPKAWKLRWDSVDIKQEHWKPDDVRLDYQDQDWCRFINSHIPRFDRLIPYEKFYLYIEQARRWHEETKDLDITLMDESQAYEFARQEDRRMADNKLYALNRYIRIQEDLFPEGRKYSAGAPQALLAFLYDRGNDILLLKGRQAAITSTVMAMVVIDMIMHNKFNVVLLTDDKIKTGQGILDKKVQGTVQLLPEWIRNDIDPIDTIWHKEGVSLVFEAATSKVEKRRNSSDLSLMSSDDSQAVNSKTPSRVLYDEVQNIANFEKISKEVAPTQIAELNGKHVKVRSQIAWGTGTSTDAGKGVFERMWFEINGLQEKFKPTGGWVAMFFDWTCRPNFTAQSYRNEMITELRDAGGASEESLAIFFSHYPSAPADSFMARHNGVVPAHLVKANRDLINALPDYLRPIRGLFIPIYDVNRPTQGKSSEHPYYIKGAEFREAVTQQQLLMAVVQMWMRPDNTFVHRYFQGTDPIQSTSGKSKFASAIYDAYGTYRKGCCGTDELHYHPTIACIINGRTRNPKDMFTQSVLMNLFYHDNGRRGCPELIEANQGHNYIEFKQTWPVDQSANMIMRTQLRSIYQRGEARNPVGFWMSSDTKATLLGDLEAMYYMMGHNIKFMDFHDQFANLEVTETDGNKKTFGTRDYENINDDLVICSVLGKVCCESINKLPIKVGGPDAPEMRTRRVIKRVATPFGGSHLVEVYEPYKPKYY